MPDANGYPTDDELVRVREWLGDAGYWDLMEYIRGIWWCADWGISMKDNIWHVSTGGWSGNEDIIDTMQSNTTFWMMCWYETRRGGHYTFRLPAHPKRKHIDMTPIAILEARPNKEVNWAREHPIMPHVEGEKEAYRCPCGCNVFHHPNGETSLIECNACGIVLHEGKDFERGTHSDGERE